jgi:hypothetical protein
MRINAFLSFHGYRASEQRARASTSYHAHPSIVFSSFVCGAHERLLYQTMSIVGNIIFICCRNFRASVLSGRVFSAAERGNLFFTLDLTPQPVYRPGRLPFKWPVRSPPRTPASRRELARSHCALHFFSVYMRGCRDFIWSIAEFRFIDCIHQIFASLGLRFYFPMRLGGHRCAPSHSKCAGTESVSSLSDAGRPASCYSLSAEKRPCVVDRHFSERASSRCNSKKFGALWTITRFPHELVFGASECSFPALKNNSRVFAFS